MQENDAVGDLRIMRREGKSITAKTVIINYKFMVNDEFEHREYDCNLIYHK
jgi:hypothetical protein